MPELFRVSRWNEIYEKNRTREMAQMRWVAVPVNLAGDGYTLTMAREDGPALYGAFVSILQVAAHCSTRGTLMRSNGLPHDAASIARKARMNTDLIERALAWFVTRELKWLEKGPFEPGAELVRDACGDGAPQDTTVHNSTKSTGDATEPPPPTKKKYRDKVKLTEHEHARLVNAHGDWFTERCLDKLDAWKDSKGKRLKSDYKAILNWVVGAIREDILKGRLIQPNEGDSHGGKYDGAGATV